MCSTLKFSAIDMNSSDGISLDSSLLGFCSLHNLSYFKTHGVLLRSDDDFTRHRERVALISGGGAGHEPGHIGFVGRGMLSAAVTGSVFTSPTVTRFENYSEKTFCKCFILFFRRRKCGDVL